MWINMPVLLAVIICPIVFGVCFILQTAYFLYKVLKSQHVDYSKGQSVSTISITDTEAYFCMGLIWTSCIDKTTKRMSLKAFIAWYIIALIANILLTVLLYVFLYESHRIYV